MVYINKTSFRNSLTNAITFHVYEVDEDSVTDFLKVTSRWDVQFVHAEAELTEQEIAREFGLARDRFLVRELEPTVA